MSNVYSIEQEIADSCALIDAATEAGIPTDAARRLCAALYEMPMPQVLRICQAASKQKDRERQREIRKQGNLV